jgi:hypothetical protein
VILGPDLVVQPAVVDKQPTVVDKQHQLVHRQPADVDKQLLHFLPTTPIHLLQLARTVSIVIVFVMLGNTTTITARHMSVTMAHIPGLMLLTVEILARQQGPDNIVLSILAVLMVVKSTFIVEEQET